MKFGRNMYAREVCEKKDASHVGGVSRKMDSTLLQGSGIDEKVWE